MSTLIRRAWPQALSAALGLWLMAAPAILGYAGTDADVHRIVGPVVASLAFVAMWDHVRPLRWANLSLAAALLVAPLVFDFAAVAIANGVAVAVALAALAFVRGDIEGEFGGGWSALWTGETADAAPGAEAGAGRSSEDTGGSAR